ncbi:MAG: hypothetical protein IPP71_07990 [Bacteroidetes bacterium]|nr:hypothetical protein [Bacteroidota bacterium]
MKKVIYSFILTTLIFIGLFTRVSAQFNSDSSQTFFVCNATGVQNSVSAFGDSNGGTYSFWIDKRIGTAGFSYLWTAYGFGGTTSMVG